MQEYFEGVERARAELNETPFDDVKEMKILTLEKKFQRSFISDAICDYTKVRDKKRKTARKIQKAGRKANRGR